MLPHNKEHRKSFLYTKKSLYMLFHSKTKTCVKITSNFLNGNSISFQISLLDLRYYYCSCSQTSFLFHKQWTRSTMNYARLLTFTENSEMFLRRWFQNLRIIILSFFIFTVLFSRIKRWKMNWDRKMKKCNF